MTFSKSFRTTTLRNIRGQLLVKIYNILRTLSLEPLINKSEFKEQRNSNPFNSSQFYKKHCLGNLENLSSLVCAFYSLVVLTIIFTYTPINGDISGICINYCVRIIKKVYRMSSIYLFGAWFDSTTDFNEIVIFTTSTFKVCSVE